MKSQTKHWKLYPPAPRLHLDAGPEHPVLAQVLYNRGVRVQADMAAFLAGNHAVKENPYRLKGMVEAVQRLLQAIDSRQTICVYGDFDADGVTATALLVTALQTAGARVGPYIPHRVDEGYGLNLEAIETIAAKGAKVIITVDCGIRSVAEVARAVELGLDVIVTDHHSIGPIMPPALAVINPKRADNPDTFDGLAGVGVAYRLAQGILRAVSERDESPLSKAQVEEIETDLLDLVAIGTVADMLPLVGENRSLVQRGLTQLNRTQRPGLLALYAVAAVQPGTVDTTTIGFRIAPRINAAGRLDSAALAYKLLRTTDPAEAAELAQELESLNQRRRTLTEEVSAQAEAQLTPQIAGDAPLYLVSGPDFLSGIVGLVAGRLTDRLYRPTLVIEEGAEESRGSARSIQEFHITAALDEISHLLVRHGGHHMAAGFTLRSERLAEFKTAITAIAHRELSAYDGDLRPTLLVDAELPLVDVNWGLTHQLARLEPTGQGNPTPTFLFPNCRVRDHRTVGKGQHLKLTLSTGKGAEVMDAIAFGLGEWAGELKPGIRVDLVGQIGVNEWNNEKRLQVVVEDMRLAEK